MSLKTNDLSCSSTTITMHLFRVAFGLCSLCVVFQIQAQFLTTTLPNIIPPMYVYSDQAMMDLDDDGDQDGLVVGTGRGVLAYLNDGLYTYEFPQLIYADPDTWAAAFGDLNGDGLGDLVCVTGTWIDDQHLVAVIQTAPFLFQTFLIDSVTDSPGPLAPYLVDLDGDGDIDILWPTSETPIHLNDGTGTFLPGTPLMGYPTSQMAFGDLDGNGTLDLINPLDNDINWFSGLGDGTFAQEQPLIPDLGNPMTDMKFSDMDGDEDLDVIVCQGNWSPGSILLYFNDGAGGMSSAVSVFGDISELEYYITVADLDGDGDNDIVTKEPLGQRFRPNNGNATFGASQALFAGIYSGATYLTPVDVDLDGDLDLCAADLRIAINDGSGSMSLEQELTYSPMTHAKPADMDGDGDLDLVSSFRDWLRNEEGVMDAWVGVNDTLDSSVDGIYDVDLDGDMDQVSLMSISGNAYLLVMKNDGSGHFFQETSYPISAFENSHFAMGDLDQDGDLDAVLEPSQDNAAWFRNNGSMDLTFAAPIAYGYADIVAIDVRDINGDGLLDILVSRADSISISVGTGGGNFANQTLHQNGSYYKVFASADVDGDGYFDLVAGSAGLDLYRGDGQGGFLQAEPIIPGSGPYIGDVALLELDGDNLPDLLYSNYEGGSTTAYVAWRHNDGTTPFPTADTLAQYVSPSWGEGVASFASLDLEGDGDIDVVSAVGTSYGQIRIHRNQTGGSCAFTGSVFADLDQDQVQGLDEPGLPWAVVNTDEPSSFVILDSMGTYSNLADTGTYVVHCTPPFPWWQLSTSQSTYTVQLATAGSEATGINFGYYPGIDTISIACSISSATTRCNHDIHQWLIYRNQGTIAPLHGQVRFVKDPGVGFLSSVPSPDAITGDTLLWDFQGLSLFEERNIVLTVHMPGVDFQGDTIHGAITVVGSDDGDVHTQVTTTSWSSVITCAYDPNDKQVEPVGFGEYGAIDIGTEALTYTIRFQNTGLDTAFTVTLTDQLDALLDRSDITVLGSSHNLTSMTIAPDGLLTFRFENILLPAVGSDSLGSLGFVRFRIGILGEPSDYSQVHNTAQIYFDYNPPIVTNTVVNTLVDCSTYVPTITALQDDWLTASPGIAYQWYLDGWATPDHGPMIEWLDAGYFTVEVTTAFGCQGMSAPIALGMEDLAAGRLLVYPNPTHRELTVQFPHVLSGQAQLQVLDQLGRMVMVTSCARSRQVTLNMSAIQAGVYLVRVVENGSPSANTRIVVD